jgi:hypothetical protein
MVQQEVPYFMVISAFLFLNSCFFILGVKGWEENQFVCTISLEYLFDTIFCSFTFGLAPMS